ncbi:unnamed protein product [Penicillium camemberti]|uniref:Str. FM013 n=1 Tax=Penicillium camemberti (strain FM 013) TaxID=1429867 RepID=A0A0G4P1L8_PENC3|nr:unnamed protein product [Penicillium camemberti]
MMIDNSTTTESNNTSTKANTTTKHLQRSCPLLALWRSAIETLCRDRNIDPMSLLEQIDVGILVAALASALPDRDGDIPMRCEKETTIKP